LNMHYTTAARVAVDVERLVRDHGVDVVQQHNEQELGVAGLGRAQDLGLPTVWVMHDFWPICTMRFLTDPTAPRHVPNCERVEAGRCDECVGEDARRHTEAMAQVVARCNAAVVPSQRARELLVTGGLPPEPFHVIHPWIDLERFAPVPDVIRDPRQVLFASNLLPHKGVDVLLEAWPTVTRWIPGANLQVLTDPRRLDLVMERSAALTGITLRPAVGQAALQALYARSALTVFPSVWEETVGLVWVESLACGTPVIASRTGGIPELLTAGGVLSAPGDAHELGDHIVRLLGRPRVRRAMSRGGRDLVSANFSPDRAARRFEALYRSLSLTVETGQP